MADITELAQSLKRRAASANEFGEGLFFIKADDVLALVEALEKAKLRIEELEHKHCGGSLMERELAHSEVIYKLMSEIDNLDSRIAELESRTVKLPDLRQIVSGDRYVWSDGVYNYSQDVKVALAAAGIKVEAE